MRDDLESEFVDGANEADVSDSVESLDKNEHYNDFEFGYGVDEKSIDCF